MLHCRHDSHISQQEEWGGGNVDERQWPFEPAQHNYRKNVGWIKRFYCHVLYISSTMKGKDILTSLIFVLLSSPA